MYSWPAPVACAGAKAGQGVEEGKPALAQATGAGQFRGHVRRLIARVVSDSVASARSMSWLSDRQSLAHPSPFEAIRRTNAAGTEFWSSRDFARVLGYSDDRNFEQVVQKARMACFNSAQRVEDHFVDVTEMVDIGRVSAWWDRWCLAGDEAVGHGQRA